MLRNLQDVLGKNILCDMFRLRGLAETETEVAPGHAKRIDLWFVPDEAKLAADAPDFRGILAMIAVEAAAIELWSNPLSVDDFHATLGKRAAWHELLEQRDKRPWSRPVLWHLCAGKPETVLEEFAYERAEIPGWYRPAGRGLRVQIVVIGELRKTRGTLLLRLLGRGRVRRDALKEYQRLPADAWEKQVAHTWLLRVGLEVDVDRLVAPEDREFVMDIKAWYKDFIETHDREVEARVLRELEPQIVNPLAHLFERRVGRTLSADERETLTACVKKYGSEHLADLVLDLSGPELAAWLEKNGVARND